MHKFQNRLVICVAALALFAGAAQAAGTWNRGANSDVQSLDPHKTSTVEEHNILLDLFTGLVTDDANGNLIPGAAESWTVSADGKVYTFKLRKDDVWSDGTPVKASDVVFSWKRLLDPKTGSEYASMAFPVLNAEDINGGKKKPDELGVKAIDDTTLEVTLKGPTPYFLEMLTHHAMYPVSEANVTKFGDDYVKAGNLVSNGAFTLAENVPGDHIKLVKNPKFFDAANVKLDGVTYIPTEDRAAGVKRYKAGEVDSMNDFPGEQLAEMKKEMGDQLHMGPELGTYYYIFKSQKAPWNNPDLRNAISMVIDRDQLADKVWKNSMLPGYSLVPPGIKGYSAAMMDYAKMGQLDREDAAKKVFEKLGISPSHPMKLELRYNTSENHKNTAVAFQEMLKPFGFDVSFVTADGKTHYSYLEQKGDFDVARAGWIADFKDPVTFLNLGHTGDGNNYGEYSNKDYDALLDQAAVEADPAKRMDELSKAEAILIKDLPLLPLLYYANHNLVSPKIHGFVDNVMDVHPSRFVSKD
ncbi:MAG: peptide ABC transporter substrate-binding protein [Alphaproteobacteria bacterium]|nr:peptide ABC transporter substrate-binding protein [Alphaproteobacteria bacterium]